VFEVKATLLTIIGLIDSKVISNTKAPV